MPLGKEQFQTITLPRSATGCDCAQNESCQWKGRLIGPKFEIAREAGEETLDKSARLQLV
jgi:hypothetical protein